MAIFSWSRGHPARVKKQGLLQPLVSFSTFVTQSFCFRMPIYGNIRHKYLEVEEELYDKKKSLFIEILDPRPNLHKVLLSMDENYMPVEMNIFKLDSRKVREINFLEILELIFTLYSSVPKFRTCFRA